jgi:ABC-type sugar transport system ATPase subunit
VLEASRVSKRYGGIHALADVDFDLRGGEIHGLVGENGAGKSTLVRLLSGAERPDKGSLRVAGNNVAFRSPAAARELGIVAISQELALVPWLTVAENIVLGREHGRAGVVSIRRARATARSVLEQLDVGVDVRAPISTLSTAERQLVEIARALAASARFLIMDEPTSCLPGTDAARVIEIMKRLRATGSGVVFISHRLEEVIDVADQTSVLRGGRNVATLTAGEASPERLIQLMTGSDPGHLFPPKAEPALDRVLLEVSSISRDDAFEDVSFDVRAGEVVGFAGLVGSGRTEVMRAVCGLDRLSSGTVSIDGEARPPKSPRRAIEQGLVYVPEDRKELGLVLGLSGYANVALPSLRRFERWLTVRDRPLRAAVSALAARMQVRGRLERPVSTLSGGNQQKLVLAKWMLGGAKVVVLDEPTRGIDVGAKRDVYELISQLAGDGVAVVLVSSEMPELLAMSDRIVVMSGGRVHDRLDRAEFDEQRILKAAFAAHTVRHLGTAA